MTAQHNLVRSLDTLVRLHDNNVERLQAELLRQQTTLERYRVNLRRLAALCGGDDGAQNTLLNPGLALNSGAYRITVLDMAARHRVELTQREATLALAQHALQGAWRQREVLRRVRDSKSAALAQAQQRAATKREDFIAVQWWSAQKKSCT